MPIYLEDFYQDPRTSGTVIGSTNSNGGIRKGEDHEARLSIDNEALRIQPMLNPGWGRSGILYGPYKRENGLALIIHILNGHNSSQTGVILDGFKGRLKQWLRGSNIDSRKNRLLRWFLAGPKKTFLNQVRYWYKFRKENQDFEYIDASLALGWFCNQALENPFDSGNLFYIRSTGPENGEVQVRVGNQFKTVVPSLQNIPVYFFVVLREKGAVYYAATLEGVPTLSAYPKLQPLAIDPFSTGGPVYGGFFQSVLGEIGFRVDTRVYATKIARVEEFNTWYGSAHAADKLNGSGPLDGRYAEIGGGWITHQGRFRRSEVGVHANSANSLATLSPNSPSGLVHALVNLSHVAKGKLGLVWRFKDVNNYFILLISHERCVIQSVVCGKTECLQSADNQYLQHGVENSVQIVDRSDSFQVYLNGKAVFDHPIANHLLSMESGVGISIEHPSESMYIHSFEAHPRDIQVPSTVELDLLQIREGKETSIFDDFEGKSGPLEHTKTKDGTKQWKKILGKGNFVLREGRCFVEASVERPNPGRTAYTVEWDFPSFADLTVNIQPPGVKRGEGERGRGGVIFYQDPGNYVIVNTWLDDYMKGASISSFFKINGFEDIYDAVWTNIGNRVYYGLPYQLRVTFDGLIYTAFVNDEPVLYRSLRDVYPSCRRLQIKQVGIVANWEWGEDTGSAFLNFEARV